MNAINPDKNPLNQHEALSKTPIGPSEIYERHGELLARILDRGEYDSDPDAYRQFVEGASRLEYDEKTTYRLDMVENQSEGLQVTNILLLDEAENGNLVGYGVIAYLTGGSRHPNRQNKPYVGDTETLAGYQRQGYGGRRLRLMNTIAQTTWNQPLESDPGGVTDDEAALVWQKLVRTGEAEQLEAPDGPRWKFIS